MENIKKSMRYSDAELAEFKAIIDAKIAQAREEFTYAKEQLIELNEEGEHSKLGDFESGSTHSEREYLGQIMERQQKFIRSLEFALMRISNKTYGVCRVTGELIDKRRLKLVPHTTLSVKAKNV
ncbi:MAG: TraR/DksA family transcriptional regulator [Chitinophagales bacterium]